MSHILKALVAETSTTTGTGAMALAAALTDHRRFSAVCSTGDTVEYMIRHATDGTWEAGIGTYSAANTLTRTSVSESSNSNAAVSFAVGTKTVVLTPLASRIAVNPGLEFVSRATASGAAFIAFTGLQAGYSYEFVGAGLQCSAAGGVELHLNVSHDNGATWNSGSTDFTMLHESSGAFSAQAAAYGDAGAVYPDPDFMSFRLVSDEIGEAGVSGKAFALSQDILLQSSRAIYMGSPSAISAVKFTPASGTITGNITCYRRRLA